MKERYEALELNIVKIPVEDTIMMMSNLEDDNDHEIPPEWEEFRIRQKQFF